MGLESPFAANLSGSTNINTYAEGPALGFSTDQINQFLAEHPTTAGNPTLRLQDTTGELQALDEAKASDRFSLRLMARNCAEALDADITQDRKRLICRAKLDTLVRMQNPDFALEEVLVHAKADEIDHDFTTEQWLLGRDHGITPAEIDAMRKPGEELRRDFKAYVNQAYDMGALKNRARDTFTPYLNAPHASAFEMLTTDEVIDDPARVAAFGCFVTARVVELQSA